MEEFIRIIAANKPGNKLLPDDASEIVQEEFNWFKENEDDNPAISLTVWLSAEDKRNVCKKWSRARDLGKDDPKLAQQLNHYSDIRRPRVTLSGYLSSSHYQDARGIFFFYN